jgi:hypothetical protein
MLKSSDSGYTGRSYSGLELDLSKLSSAPEVGSRVTVKGTAQMTTAGPILEVASLSLLSTGEPTTPVTVTAAEFSNVAEDVPLNGLLVSLSSVTLSSNMTTTWSLIGSPSGSLTVGNRLIGTLPSYSPGTVFSPLIGIADTLDSGYLLPRTESDIHET